MRAASKFATFLLTALRAAFSSPLYAAAYLLSFYIGLSCGGGMFVAPMALLAFVVLILPAALAAFVMISFCIRRSVRLLLSKQWAVRTGHAAAPLVLVAIGLLGFRAAEPVAIAFATQKLNAELANFLSGVGATNANIEIISSHPEVAAYAFHNPGFAAPVIGAYHIAILFDVDGCGWK